jgi:phosphonate transport system substrate-binding protein
LIKRWWFLLVLGNFLCIGPASSALAQERVIGVVPQGAPTDLALQWQPLIKYLRQSTGINIRFATAPTITRFEQRVLQGEYDYAYMNPLLYVRAEKQLDYRGLVRRKNPLRGILVVKKGAINKLGELNGTTIAFPSPTAFGATLLMRAELDRKKIKYHVSYAGTHESGYQSVIVGRYAAAGGVMRTLALLPAKSRSELTVLLQTRPVIGHVIAAHPRVPRTEAKRIAEALKTLQQNATGRKLLQGLKINQFVATRPSDFASIKRMSFPASRKINMLKLLVIPRLNESDTIKQMNPMVSYIRQQLELELDLETFPTMGAFDKAIAKEKGPAIINANPLQAIRLSKQGFRVIAQQTPVSSPEGMRGLILVAKNSPYKTLADLKGKRIAFGGNRNAFFASVVPRVLLARAGLHGKYKDVSKPGPVSDVVRRLYEGDIDAAGTGLMAVNSQLLKEKYHIDEMRIITKSEAMPGLTWLVSKDLPDDMVEELRDVLLNFGPDSPGHRVMTSAGIASIQPATIKSYIPVEKYIREEARLR